MKIFASKLVVLVAALMLAAPVWAAKRPAPPKEHEEVFGEDALSMGVRGGLLVSGLTALDTTTPKTDFKSALKYSAGFALEFYYSWARVSFDILYATRRGLDDSITAKSFSLPVIGRIPLRLWNGFDIELGGGLQPDYIISGAQPSPMWIIGPVGAFGFVVDEESFLFSIEGRYFASLSGIDDHLAGNSNGGSPRDFSLLLGFMWKL